nr:HD domain-containing phosphohydrolase [Wenzhouxiangella sp. XN24]
MLIVDDEAVNLALLTRLLRPAYRVRAVNSGARALQAVTSTPRPDLVLLDVLMPDMDGYQVLAALRGRPETHDIPVIFLTALAEADDEERGLQSGAADYITKPIKPAVLQARVGAQLEAKRAREFMRDKNAFLEAEIARRMSDNEAAQQVGIRALAHLAETRDSETGNHILRTQYYVRLLAEHLQTHPRFRDVLTPANIELLAKSAPLHDIGKVGIPDAILQKPGPLTADEWETMKRHARMGYDAIERAEADVDRPVPFLVLAKEIARWHHERWDGTGYPDGLAGEAIPVSARIMAVADVFDAMSSSRAYKAAIEVDAVRDFILAGSGTQFDPDVTAAFEALYPRFAAIARRHADAPGT